VIAALLIGPIAVALALGGACSSCSHGVAAPGQERKARPTPSSAAPSNGAAADGAPPPNRCHAGSLPRFTEKTLVGTGLGTLLADAEIRPIAVIWSARGVELVTDCKLGGDPYVHIPGKNDQGQFRPASRLIYRTDELEGACRAATHLVAAFAVDGPASGRSGTAVPQAGALGSRHLEGILLPLPCPSVVDPKAAPGCVGKGLTGGERRSRAVALWARLPRVKGVFADVAQPLELYALVPDHFWGLTLPRWVEDRMLAEQGSWLMDQYDLGKVVLPRGQEEWMVDLYAINSPVEPPTAKLEDVSRRSSPFAYWDRGGPGQMVRQVNRDPAFLWCFPTLVDPDVHYEVIF